MSDKTPKKEDQETSPDIWNRDFWATPFRDLRRELATVMDGFFHPDAAGGQLGKFLPTVDISETDAELKIRAELSGMDEKDVEVSVTDEHLILSGEKKVEDKTDDETFHRVESSYGSFRRVIPLGRGYESEKAKANFKKGVLTITVPKIESAKIKSKKIEVKGG